MSAKLSFLKILTLLILFFSFTHILNINYTRDHEMAHVEIMKHYGCQNASYNIKYFQSSGTSHCEDEGGEYYSKDFSDEIQLHMLNEVIGYNVSNIGNYIMAGFVLLSMAIILVSDSR